MTTRLDYRKLDASIELRGVTPGAQYVQPWTALAIRR